MRGKDSLDSNSFREIHLNVNLQSTIINKISMYINLIVGIWQAAVMTSVYKEIAGERVLRLLTLPHDLSSEGLIYMSFPNWCCLTGSGW